MKKNRVVTISKFKSGGAGIAAFRLHNALAKTNYDNVFVTSYIKEGRDSINLIYLKNNNKIKRILKRILKKVNVNLIDRYLKQKKILESYRTDCEIKSLPYSNYELEKNEIIKNADIVHLHWVAEFVNYKYFFKKTKQPIVWTLHDMNPFQGVFHYKKDELKNKKSIGFFDDQIKKKKRNYIHIKKNIHIVCLSKWMMEESKKSEIFGIYPHYLIPNGLEKSKYSEIDNINKRKKEIGLKANSKTFLFIAQDLDNHRKGFHLLYEALKKITNDHVNIITIGDNKPHLFENFTHVHFSNLEQGCEINEKYQMADLVLLPSIEDNLPNVMLESFFNGTPVLAFNTGGMKEHIKHGVTGVLIDCFDTLMLSKEILNVLNNEYHFEKKIIKEYALNHFDVNIQINKYKDLYNKILN